MLRRSDEGVDDARDLLRVLDDDAEALSVLRRRAVASKCNLRLRHQLRERRTQLVRELGREAPLVAQARGQAIEQPVERRTETSQLVVRRAEAEASVEILLAPRCRLLGHLRDRAKRRAK